MVQRHNTCKLIGALPPLIAVVDKHLNRDDHPFVGAWLVQNPSPLEVSSFANHKFTCNCGVRVVSVDMDVSPVHSSAKCSSSDFSIERILSDDSVGSREQSSEPPSWLCCTRYQPPRLPRAANNSTCRGRRSGRHARVPFTAAQAAALEAAYARAPYLAPPALRALAAALNLRDDRIKIWFQNRRARERREKSSTIIPPRDVALPPTTHFKPQGSTPRNPWFSQSNIESNSLPKILGTDFIMATRIQNDLTSQPAAREFPQDLTVSTSLMPPFYHSNGCKEERSHSPLDIETLED